MQFAATAAVAALGTACGRWLLEPVRRAFRALAERRTSRRAWRSLAGLNGAALKDIGLSRSDLPSVRAGLMSGDDTRRKR